VRIGRVFAGVDDADEDGENSGDALPVLPGADAPAASPPALPEGLGVLVLKARLSVKKVANCVLHAYAQPGG
jgi:hypothetical protein